MDQSIWHERLQRLFPKPASSAAVVSFLAATHDAINWWAATIVAAFVVILLVGTVCWMARYTDAAEVKTPLLTWRRRNDVEQDRKPSDKNEPNES